jgi:transglutaminase-like putative cysteine protease/tetratricopeptide (TPR) repeat protein
MEWPNPLSVLSYPRMSRTIAWSALGYALAVLLVPFASPGQSPTKAASPNSFADEALVFERSETTYTMHADGTGERESHVLVRLQSQGAAQQFGVLSFAYASANEAPLIKLVRVHKPEGTIVDTPPSDAIDMPSAVTREAPLYSDLKEKHLPVRSLSPGDTLEYDVQVAINKAEAPGQFWGVDHFTPPGTAIALAEILNLKVPSDKYVQVWSPNHKPTISDHDGVRTYTWNVPQLISAPKSTGDDSTKPVPPKDIDEDADGRKLPSVAWTTFHSWAEVGDWYRSLALSQAQPTDALRARADELTKGAKTPEDQVRAIYQFVSTRTRYVGIDFGVGRYQPHSAAEVLANQYGDCKDKDTLLEALLRAKGFSTAPALIGAGIAPVPDVPSPAVFNHVITTVNLPDGRIWLDSTPAVAPYRFLTAVIRDEKALVVPANAPAELTPTPAAGPFPYTEHFEAVASLDADGKLTGKITAAYRDDSEIYVRALALNIAPAEWDKASQYISSATGFSGTTSNTHFTNADDYSAPIAISYDYARHPYGDWDNRRIVPLFPALEFAALDDDAKEPQQDIQLGAPRTLTATSTISLPKGYRTDLPDPIHVKTDFATFDKTYRFDGQQIVAERTIVVQKEKLPKTDWKRYQAFTKDIGLSGENWIQLIQPQKITFIGGKPGAIPPPPPASTTPSAGNGTKTIPVPILPLSPANIAPPETATPDNASAADLMKLAQDRLRAGDTGGAKETLDKVKAKNPDEEYLWGMYGAIATMERNDEEAKADFRKELTAHSDNVYAAGALAAAQAKAGDTVGARQTLRQFLDQHPDLRLSFYLASLQTNAHDYSAALKTLQAAAEQNPDDRHVQIQIGNTLLLLDRKEEAAAVAKGVLDGADDPEILNNAAYALSETGIDLPLAEDSSRKSIAHLEEKSATMAAAEANSKTFAEANLLIASWDTLGWILFREGKYDAAKQFISPAWRASLRAEVGDHLGQVDEALGQKDDALTAYTCAAEALTPNETPDIRGHITDSIARLKAAGAIAPHLFPSPASVALNIQELRTYRFPRPNGVKGWGTFRLEITTAGVIESQQMSGEPAVAVLKPSIAAIKFSELLPPDSKAHLLRSAVVSCSQDSDKTCEVVLVPDGGLQTEQP